MIIEFLITIFFNILIFLVSLLPAIDFTMPQNFVDLFSDILYSAAYFLPLNVILPLVVCSIVLDMVHITWKGLMRIKSFIPTMGD